MMHMFPASENASTVHTSVGVVITSVAFVALVSGLCAFFVHQGCFHPPPPVTRPDPTTARAGFCSAVQSSRPWLSLTLIPPIVVCGIAAAARGRNQIVLASVVVVCLGLVALATLANTLTSSLTV